LQLPSEKFQKSHKKFRMFDKNHDHHIGTPNQQLFEKSGFNFFRPAQQVSFNCSFSFITQILPSFPKGLLLWAITLTRRSWTSCSPSEFQPFKQLLRPARLIVVVFAMSFFSWSDAYQARPQWR
jgi:hypothetical protein